MSSIRVPQEIIDLIIDNVASSNPLERPTSDTLSACSLVSSSFGSRARKHLFSNMHFVIDKYAEKFIAKLRWVLQLESNRSLVQDVRSLRLVFDMSLDVACPKDILSSKQTSGNSRLSKNLGLEEAQESNLTQVLEILSRSSITDFEMGAFEGYFDMNEVGDRARAALLSICSGSALRVLRFNHLMYLPGSFVVGEPMNCLRELALRNIWFQNEEAIISSSITNTTNNFSEIERLEFTNVRCQSSEWVQFPRLTSLTILVQSLDSEMETVQKIMEGSAHSIKNLVLTDIDPHPNLWDTIRLDKLPSLETLVFNTSVWLSLVGHDFITKRTTIADLLRSSTSPINLQSITLDFHLPIVCALQDDSPEWPELDDALMSPQLADLCKVVVNLDVDRHPGGIWPYLCLDLDFDDRLILPRVRANQRIELDVKISE